MNMKTMKTGVLMLIAVVMVSCSNGQNSTANGTIAENVNIETFMQKMNGAQLLDVRTPDEWNKGIIENAQMINIYSDDFQQQIEKLDKEKPVAVYCKSGGRSGKAMGMMKKMGFKEVYNLKGGMDGWKRSAKPTVKP